MLPQKHEKRSDTDILSRLGYFLISSTKHSRTHLIHVLERIGILVPIVDEVIISLAHNEIKVLIFFARDNTVMMSLLSIIYERAPAISMYRLKQSETRPIEP